MTSDAPNRYAATLESGSRVASVFTIGVGLVVLAGWLFNITALKTILPGTIAAKSNTAVAFILTGSVMWLLRAPASDRRRLRLRRGLAVLLALIGLLTLSEYLLGWNLGIDELLFRDNGFTGLYPGRMAPITVVDFLLLSAAFLLLDTSSRYHTAQFLALATASLGLLAFLGYLYGETSLYKLANFTAIALPTAITFIVAGLGVLFARPDRGWMSVVSSDSAGGKLARRLLPAAVIVPIIIGWLRLMGQNAGWYGTGFGLALFAVSNIVVFSVLIASSAASLVVSDIGRQEAETQIKALNAELEGRVLERTTALTEANAQLTYEIAERREIEAALARESDLLQALMDNLPDTIYFKDTESRFTRINQAQARVLGVPRPEDALGKTDADFQAPHLATAHMADERHLLESGQPQIDQQEYHPALDGQPRWFSSNKVAIRDRQGRIVGLVGISHNITQRMQADEALHQANAQLTERVRQMSVLNELVEHLQACLGVSEVYQVTAQWVSRLFPAEAGALYVTNNSHNWIETAAAWGTPPLASQVLGMDDCWALRLGRPHLSGLRRDNALPCQHLLGTQPALSVCIPLLGQGETLGIWHLRASTEADACRFDEVVLQLARVVADSVALAIANLNLRDKLRQQSIRDPLTDLFNRRYMEESLELELQRAARSQRPVSVIMLDIDHFKTVNDLHGHAAGDAVLRQLGRFLKEHTRGGDIASRYGGEEFTLILPDATLEQAHFRAEQHRQKFKELDLRHGEKSIGSVTISFGVAAYPQHGQTAEQVLRAADAALYQSKHEGRDQVHAAS